MQSYSKHYVGPMTECPDCEGRGRVSYLTFLGYDGSQAWSTMECPTCGGSGQVPDPAPEPGDTIGGDDDGSQ